METILTWILYIMLIVALSFNFLTMWFDYGKDTNNEKPN